MTRSLAPSARTRGWAMRASGPRSRTPRAGHEAAARSCADELGPGREEISRSRAWALRATPSLPLLRPGVIAAWLLLFVASVRELGASILLTGPNAKAITPAIVEAWFSISTELTAAMALIQTLAVALALALLFTFARRASQYGGE